MSSAFIGNNGYMNCKDKTIPFKTTPENQGVMSNMSVFGVTSTGGYKLLCPGGQNKRRVFCPHTKWNSWQQVMTYKFSSKLLQVVPSDYKLW